MGVRRAPAGARAWIAAAVLVVAAAAGACGGAPNPTNELPFGAVDMPQAGAVVPRGPLVVGGWAMDDTGVSVVRLYVNRRFVAETRLEVPRPDLIKVYPAYLHGTEFHGWNVTVTLTGTGPHEILAQAVDRAGATRDLGVVNVTVVD